MSAVFVTMPGDVVAPDQLRSAKAGDLAERLSRGTFLFAGLVQCRTTLNFDIVISDVQPEIPQDRAHDIRPTERVAFWFPPDDSEMPAVLALREDFPVTPHMFPTEAPPRHLCLFEEEYADLKLRWTSKLLVRRLLDWLRLTARGELHAQDQPLEQVFLHPGHRIILPHDLSEPTTTARALTVKAVHDDRGKRLFVLEHAPQGTGVAPHVSGHGFVAITHVARPQHPGPVRSSPSHLGSLHALLAAAGDDLIGSLRTQILALDRRADILASDLLLVVCLAQRRAPEGPIESFETWAFGGSSVQSVGAGLGVWHAVPTGVALMIPVDDTQRGESVELAALNVHFTLSRDAAAHYNQRQQADNRLVVAVGAGALGSQVILNAARAAYGRWAVIDHDRLFPHNVARHALGEIGVGYPKSVGVSAVANRLTDGAEVFEPIVANLLAPGDRAAHVAERLEAADAIADFSASIPVARYLAHGAPGAARRVSFYLNPTGTDLVMLAEDRERRFRLDALEMQYYRAVMQETALNEHLRWPEGRVRFGRSCRDVSFRLPQELVALHAAIATRNLRGVLEQDGAVIRVWRADPEFQTVSMFAPTLHPVITQPMNGWTVVYDECLTETIQRLRAQRLPSETGGVLLGSIDLERKRIYVVATIPSPSDSEERRTLYIRGCAGLLLAVETAQRQTLDQVGYVGEWHSHPDGFSCQPSAEDLEVLGWLSTHMDADGLPGVMMIAGQHNQFTVLLAEVVAETQGTNAMFEDRDFVHHNR